MCTCSLKLRPASQRGSFWSYFMQKTTLLVYHSLQALNRVIYFINFIFYCSFILTDLTSENMYMISLNLSVCMESVGDCIVDTQVLVNQKLPKILCSNGTGLVIPGKYCFYLAVDEQNRSFTHWLSHMQMLNLINPVVFLFGYRSAESVILSNKFANKSHVDVKLVNSHIYLSSVSGHQDVYNLVFKVGDQDIQ